MSSIPPPENRVLLVVNALKQEISKGVFVEVLPGERELSERLQVNRKTLRKAVAILEKEQWIAAAERGKRRRIIFKQAELQNSNQAPTLVGKNIVVMATKPLAQMSSVEKFFQSRLTRIAEKLGVNVLHRHLDVKHLDNPAHRLSEFVKKNPADVYLLQNSSKEIQSWFESHRKLRSIVLGDAYEGVKLPSVAGDHHATAVHLAGVLQRQGLDRVVMMYPWPARKGLANFVDSFKKVAPHISFKLIKHEESPQAVANASVVALSEPNLKSSIVLTYGTFSTVSAVTTAGYNGLRIGEDLSLLSLSDDEIFEYIHPKVAHYQFPWESYTRLVFSCVSDQLLHPHILLEAGKQMMPEFVKGNSFVAS